MCAILNGLIYSVGLVTLTGFLFDDFTDLAVLGYIKWFRPDNKYLKRHFGKWAVVTGSTDGIGLAYARELARRGLNIVLISRTESKLQAVAKQIENDFGVKTKIIVTDFTNGPEIYPHIEKELGDLPVHVLINNVGGTTKESGYFAGGPVSEVWQLINMNMGTVVQLSHYFLHRMHNAGIKGAIVNVGSFTHINPMPYLAFYAASKVFVHNFTIALEHEARPWGITVQLMSPGFVVTKLIQPIDLIARGNLFVPPAEVFARSAVSTIGCLKSTNGYFWHAVQAIIMKLVPQQLMAVLTKYLLILLVDDLKKPY